MENEYITLKLVNGDNLICLLADIDDETITVLYPIQMKPTQIKSGKTYKDVMVGTPWCTFTDDEVFEIWKSDILMIKPLNEATIEYYKNLIDVNIEEELTNQKPEIEELQDVSDDMFFIPGNKTIN